LKSRSLQKWRAAVRDLGKRLSTIDRDTGDAGLRLAIVYVWQVMAEAPSTILHQYAMVPESDIVADADAIVIRSADPDFGLGLKLGRDDAETMRMLATALRALEVFAADLDLGSAPADPNVDWRVDIHDEAYFFVPVPRRLWKRLRDESNDRRPFDQRGLRSARIVPSEIDGATVRLTRPDRAPRTAKQAPFGAVLFRGIEFAEDSDDTGFVVTAVTGTDMDGDARTAIINGHRERCLAVVFPELTVDNRLHDQIVRDLEDKDWLDDDPESGIEAPWIVVAGSWHRPISGGIGNIAPVLDGFGQPLLSHSKRYAYTDPDGHRERIIPGDKLDILVTDEGLFAFGICLDFCQRYFTTPYGLLDVDFVLVPSCGNERTMEGHLRTAQDLHNQRKIRSFVVQQSFPATETGLGYVLDPVGIPGVKPISALEQKASWSVFHAETFLES